MVIVLVLKDIWLFSNIDATVKFKTSKNLLTSCCKYQKKGKQFYSTLVNFPLILMYQFIILHLNSCSDNNTLLIFMHWSFLFYQHLITHSPGNSHWHTSNVEAKAEANWILACSGTKLAKNADAKKLNCQG